MIVSENSSNGRLAPALVVLAAGIGSRYGGLKQIDPVGPNGEVVLDYSVFDALRAGFGSVVFVIRRDIEKAFREAVGRRFESRANVRYAYQELSALPAGFTPPAERAKPWGTGHAVLCARPELDGPFAVINADDFYGAEAYRALAGFFNENPADAGGHDYAMVGYRLDRTLSEHGTTARGVCTLGDGGLLTTVTELTAIERTPEGIRNRERDGTFRALTGAETVSMNCWGFKLPFLGQLEAGFRAFLGQSAARPKAEFYLPVAMDEFIRAGQARVKVLRTDAAWFGVTYREDRPQVVASIRALIRSGAYPEALWT